MANLPHQNIKLYLDFKIMKNKFPLMAIAFFIIAMSSTAQVTGKFTDSRDGKTYKTVKIGTQTWMAENLAYKVSSGCWGYPSDSENKTYGCLYNWETAKKVCPTGWHLPTDAEFTTLTTFLGGDKVAGGKLKESGTLHWKTSNVGATNESGFTALPSGAWDIPRNTIIDMGRNTLFWSSTESESDRAYNIILGEINQVIRGRGIKTYGHPVRCIKD